jgi:hypothetical protein
MVSQKHPLDPALNFQTRRLAGPGRKGAFPGAPIKRAGTVIARGPAYLVKANIPQMGSGPGEPPPGFVTPTTSATEWYVYWALAKIYEDPLDPRQGPFFGRKLKWGYQIGLDGGRSAGGAVVDFLIDEVPSGKRLGIRVVTQYFHLGQGSGKIAQDETQKANLMKYIDVYDLYDTEVLDDRTGEKSIIATKKALSMIHSSDPIFAGDAPPNRQV